MQENILLVTAALAAGGLGLTLTITSVMVMKDAWDYEDWALGALGLILFFCSALPALGIFSSLLF